MVDFSGVVSMTLAYRDPRAYVNLWHGEVSVTMAGVQDSLFSLTISGDDSRAVVASQGSTITVTPIKEGRTVTITEPQMAMGSFYTLTFGELGGERNGLRFAVTAAGWTVSKGAAGAVVGRPSRLSARETVVVEVSDPYSETKLWDDCRAGVSAVGADFVCGGQFCFVDECGGGYAAVDAGGFVGGGGRRFAALYAGDADDDGWDYFVGRGFAAEFAGGGG